MSQDASTLSVSSVSSVGVVGAGRVGLVLAAALSAAGHELVGVSGRYPASAELAAECDLLILTVPDDALGGVVAEIAPELHEGQYVAHTSGRHGLAILTPAADAGAHPLALHPAMTFTGTEQDLDRLPGCVFGVTAAPSDRDVAYGIVADLGGRPVDIPDEMRTLYHAGLAHGANHLVTLVNEAMDILRAAGVDEPATMLRPLLTAALDNVLEMGDRALTGPIVRGDEGTVQAHLAALAESAPRQRETYVALAEATRGRIR